MKAATTAQSTMNVLTIDVGATHGKILGQTTERAPLLAGFDLTPDTITNEFSTLLIKQLIPNQTARSLTRARNIEP